MDMAETRIRLHLTNSRPQTPANMNMIETIMWKRCQMREEPNSSDIFQEDPDDLSTDLEQDTEKVTNRFEFKCQIFLFVTLLAFVGMCFIIISELPPLSNGLLWFLGIKFKVTSQLNGLVSVGVTTPKS